MSLREIAHAMTHQDYLVARVLAALEAVYPQRRSAPGTIRPSAFVEAYETLHPWVRR